VTVVGGTPAAPTVCGCGGKEDGMSILDRGGGGGGRRWPGSWVGGSSSRWEVQLFPAFPVACKTVTKWLLRFA